MNNEWSKLTHFGHFRHCCTYTVLTSLPSQLHILTSLRPQLHVYHHTDVTFLTVTHTHTPTPTHTYIRHFRQHSTKLMSLPSSHHQIDVTSVITTPNRRHFRHHSTKSTSLHPCIYRSMTSARYYSALPALSLWRRTWPIAEHVALHIYKTHTVWLIKHTQHCFIKIAIWWPCTFIKQTQYGL